MSNLFWSLENNLEAFDLGDSGAVPGVWHDRKALYFENALAAPVLLRDEFNFDCFRLQAEAAISGSEGFVGLVFGARDSKNYELVYISPGIDSGMGQIQYDPIMNGSSTWQIYNGPRYQAPAPVAPGEWVKLTLDVQPDSVAISVGEHASPQLVIPNLQHGRSIGRVGVWGHMPSYIRNFSVEEIGPAPINKKAADLNRLAAESFVTEWTVSKPYIYGGQPDPEHHWVKAFVEENGTLNLNRLYPSGQGVSVQTKSAFYMPMEKETLLTFGFSDRLRLWVNEEEVYQGEWKWDPPASDGRIRSDFAGVPVRWQAGMNTIRAEITSHEVMFGWGLCVKTGLPNLSFI